MNLYRNKKSRKWQKVLGIFLGLAFCVAALNFFQGPVKNIFYSSTASLSQGFWQAGAGAGGFFSILFNGRGIAQENANIKEENQKLLAKISQLESSLQQAKAIGEAMQNTAEDNYVMVIADVIGLNNDVLLLNKGSEDGITENMPVISSTKVLFGKVVKVYRNYSQITLISHKQSVVDVKIQQQEVLQPPILGVVKGAGNLSIYLDLIPTSATLQEGDVVASSALEGTFPKDLLVGKVLSVDKNDANPFQTAKLQPFMDVKSISTLFIITNYKQES